MEVTERDVLLLLLEPFFEVQNLSTHEQMLCLCHHNRHEIMTGRNMFSDQVIHTVRLVCFRRSVYKL